MTRIVKLLVALILVPLLTLGSIAPATTAQRGYCASDAEMEMLHLINGYRQDHGLAPLTLTARLGTGAQVKASDMADRSYLEHTSPDGERFWELLNRVGYTYDTRMAENIAAGYGSAQSTFQQWVNSTTHRETMLNPAYTAIGIGSDHNPDSQYGWYWATEFGGVVGTPASACSGGGDDQSTVEALVTVLVSILRDVLGNSAIRPVMT